MILVLARQFSSRDAPVTAALPPWSGVSVVDESGAVVLDLEQNGVRSTDGDAFAHLSVAVDPGCHYLRQRLASGQVVEQSLFACAGWRTEAYLLRKVESETASVGALPSVSVTMHRVGEPLGPDAEYEDRIIESARVALANERCILSDELALLLMMKFNNPMAGLIGGHLLLVEHERDSTRDISMLDVVVAHLAELIGDEHPDVLALALTRPGVKLEQRVLAGPPMLQRSWALLVQAASRQPALIPAALWARAQAQAALAPFLVWTTEKSVKATVRQQLARAILEPRRKTRAQRPAVAATQVVPAGMLESADGLAESVVRELSAAPRVRAMRAGPTMPSAPSALQFSAQARARAAQLNVPPSAFEALRAEVE